MNIYSIKNEKLGFFNRPVYCESDPEALSYIQNVLMSDADRALLHMKDDLSLYFIGTINFVSGVIKTPRKPILVSGLSDIFASIPEDKIPRSESFFREKIKNLEERIGVLCAEGK